MIDQTGIRITWKQSIIRNLTKIPLADEFLLFDVILGMVLDKKQEPEKPTKQRAMDILAETVVVRNI